MGNNRKRNILKETTANTAKPPSRRRKSQKSTTTKNAKPVSKRRKPPSSKDTVGVNAIGGLDTAGISGEVVFKVSEFTGSQLLRRQISLTGQFRIDDLAPPSFTPAPQILLDQAFGIAKEWLQYANTKWIPPNSKNKVRQFRQPKLIMAMIKFAPTDHGKQNLLSETLLTLVDGTPPITISNLQELVDRTANWRTYNAASLMLGIDRLQSLGDEVLNCFFLPLKACGHKTPAVRSVFSAGLRARHAPDEEQGTLVRLDNLRGELMKRDASRCVVSQLADYSIGPENSIAEDAVFDDRWETEFEEHPGPNIERYGSVEGAHILPHALNGSTDSGQLNGTGVHLWTIANIFRPGISDLVLCDRIDDPANAMLLVHDLHVHFGALRLWFTPTDEPDEYKVEPEATLRSCATYDMSKSRTIKFEDRSGKAIALPDPRLLAFHRACCQVLRLSGAAEYVDELLDELEDTRVLSQDGSSAELLGRILQNASHHIQVF